MARPTSLMAGLNQLEREYRQRDPAHYFSWDSPDPVTARETPPAPASTPPASAEETPAAATSGFHPADARAVVEERPAIEELPAEETYEEPVAAPAPEQERPDAEPAVEPPSAEETHDEPIAASAAGGTGSESEPAVEPGGPAGRLADEDAPPAPGMRLERTGAPAEIRPPIEQLSSEGEVIERPRTSVDGGGGDGGGKGGGGGGSGRGRGGPPIEQRQRGSDFRAVLTSGLSSVRRNLVTVGIFSFITNILMLAIPIYLFQISDRVLTSRSMDTLLMLTLIVVGALAIHVLLDVLRRVLLVRVATKLETAMGAPVLSAAARASQNGHNVEFQALSDLQQVRAFLTGSVLITMFDAPVAPIYILAVLLIHPHLGFILIVSCVLLLIVATINQRVTAAHYARANLFNARANHQADAMSRNSQVLNAMGMIPEAVLLWGHETAESLKGQVHAQDRNILLAGVSKMTRLCTQICMLGWGCWLAMSSELTGGMIIAASIIGSRALGPIEGTIEGWRSFIHARAAYGRIRSLLNSSPLKLERLWLPRPMGRLDVERVLYVPPPTKKVILNGVSFSLQPGESLAIVGSSGSGKTTLARMLVGAVVPTAGNVRLDLMDLRNWDPRQFGESIGYLPQDVQLFPGTIKANIARMRDDATDAAIFDAAELADVHAMISEFPQGYETYVNIDGSPLSGGQKQRIGLARAFFGDPRLLVLDEPNSNLDAAGERALAAAMLRAKERGITVVAITQRTTLLRSVDKIMLLEAGTVQAMGAREKMFEVLSKKNRKLKQPPPEALSDGAGRSEDE